MDYLWKKNKLPAYLASSPLLLAAAAALLIGIVATFAMHNYQLEKRLMMEALQQKANTLMRVIRSSAKAALFMEMRRNPDQTIDLPGQMEQLIKHISDDPDILFLCIADDSGKIIAHSDQERIGGQISLINSEQGSMGSFSKITYLIGSIEGFDRVFAAYALTSLIPGSPVDDSFGHGPGMGMELGAHHMRGRMNLPPTYLEQFAGKQYLITLGLNTSEYDQALGRLRGQILLLSMAMLLVGFGGWLSLAVVQGYKVSQKTINEVQTYTALLVAQLPIGVIATEPDGKIETWNAATVTLTGIASSKALGKKPAEVLPAELALFFAVPEKIETEADGPALVTQTLPIVLAGIRRVLFCQPLKLADTAQAYRGHVLLLSDLTEITTLEQRMQENERMAAIGRMAGGVAHEVRNPLSSIKGLAYILKSRFPEGSKDRESANLLIQETERMNRTITEMLSFTRSSELNLQPVALGELLRQTLILLQADLQDHAITVDFRPAAELPDILGDADKLRQVVMNILLNAQQSMEEGGIITVDVHVDQQTKLLSIRISDTGRGIPPEQLAQVFHPYFTTRQDGTGIGLTISQKIVTDHQGAIEIQSEPGKGTTVIIRFPISSINKAASPSSV